jgi:hypothetical protein
MGLQGWPRPSFTSGSYPYVQHVVDYQNRPATIVFISWRNESRYGVTRFLIAAISHIIVYTHTLGQTPFLIFRHLIGSSSLSFP